MALRDPKQVLGEGRKRIDSINETMVELMRMGAKANSPVIREMLRARTDIAVSIGRAKKELGLTLVDTEREAQIIGKALHKARSMGVNVKRTKLLMEVAIKSARRAQAMDSERGTRL